MVLKLDNCSYSELKVYPGTGKTYARLDSKVLRFANSKCEALYHQKVPAVRLEWTPVCRKKKNKGTFEQVQLKSNVRIKKTEKGYKGLSAERIAELKKKAKK